MQTAKLETAQIVQLEHTACCVDCGDEPAQLEVVEKQYYCQECATALKANHIVYEGLSQIAETLAAQIPESDWPQLGWEIDLGYGGEPCPKGINWHCHPCD